MNDNEDIVPVATKATIVSTGCAFCHLAQDVQLVLSIDVKGNGTGTYVCMNQACGQKNRVALDKATLEQLLSTATDMVPVGQQQSTKKSVENRPINTPLGPRSPSTGGNNFVNPNLPSQAFVNLRTHCAECQTPVEQKFNMKINKTTGIGTIAYKCPNCAKANRAEIDPKTTDSLVINNKIKISPCKMCMCCVCILCWTTFGSLCGCNEMPPCL